MNFSTLVLHAVLAIALSCSNMTFANKPVAPKPGEPFPDITLNNMEHYPQKTVKLSALRGKWVVLDLWTVGCRGCFNSFSKINDLQKKFDKDMQFILVGQPYPGIEKIYNRFATHYSLSLPVAYDTSLFTLFDVTMVPFIILIDPSGKFYNLLGPMDLTEENFSRLVEGKKLTPRPLNMEGFETYNPPPDPGTIRYARLAKAIPGDAPAIPEFEWPCHWSIYNKYGVVFKNVSPLALFRVAFFGKFFMDPRQKGWYDKHNPYLVLEGVDPSIVSANPFTNTNYYDYTFIVGDSNVGSQQLQEMVQEDLNRQFPYTISNENRMMPYYRVTASRELKEQLFSKGGEPLARREQAAGITGFQIKNGRMDDLFYEMYNYHQLDTLFIDETGMTDNIDLTMDAIMTDRESIKAGLRKAGFNVDLQYKRLHTLVLRPRNSVNEIDRK